jgi:hypothetical protein
MAMGYKSVGHDVICFADSFGPVGENCHRDCPSYHRPETVGAGGAADRRPPQPVEPSWIPRARGDTVADVHWRPGFCRNDPPAMMIRADSLPRHRAQVDRPDRRGQAHSHRTAGRRHDPEPRPRGGCRRPRRGVRSRHRRRVSPRPGSVVRARSVRGEGPLRHRIDGHASTARRPPPDPGDATRSGPLRRGPRTQAARRPFEHRLIVRETALAAGLLESTISTSSASRPSSGSTPATDR